MTMGHNSELTAKERQALFGHHVRKDVEIAVQIKSMQEQRKANRKLASNDGFPASNLNHYAGILGAEDKQKPVDKHYSERENLIWAGLIQDDPKGDLLADRATSEQMIFAAGQATGLIGGDRVSGYDGGGVDDKTWLSGYDDGQAILRENLQSAMEKRNAAKSKEAPEPDGDDPFEEAAE